MNWTCSTLGYEKRCKIYRYVTQGPLNQRTNHADDFALAPVVVVMAHQSICKMSRYPFCKVNAKTRGQIK
jgi:hypothetical protein